MPNAVPRQPGPCSKKLRANRTQPARQWISRIAFQKYLPSCLSPPAADRGGAHPEVLRRLSYRAPTEVQRHPSRFVERRLSSPARRFLDDPLRAKLREPPPP